MAGGNQGRTGFLHHAPRLLRHSATHADQQASPGSMPFRVHVAQQVPCLLLAPASFLLGQLQGEKRDSAVIFCKIFFLPALVTQLGCLLVKPGLGFFKMGQPFVSLHIEKLQRISSVSGRFPSREPYHGLGLAHQLCCGLEQSKS